MLKAILLLACLAAHSAVSTSPIALLVLHFLMIGVSSMSDQDTKLASEEVNQLVLQLPQASNAAEVFSTFAEHVQQLFLGLMHISLLLLPKDPQSSAASSSAAASGKTQQNGHAHGVSTGASSTSTSSRAGATARDARGDGRPLQQPAPPDSRAWDLMENFAAFRSGCSLDWTSCCIFNLYRGRGPVVQPPPSWPLSCTATYYAAKQAEAAPPQDMVAAADYERGGPHFLDWKALHENGARSMVAVPIHCGGKVVAVLCLASTAVGAFSRSELIKVLASVIAPYIQLLEYTTRRMEMQKLVNDIITPIAAQLAQQKQSQLARLGCTVEEGGAGQQPAPEQHHAGKASGGSRRRGHAEGRAGKRAASHSASGNTTPSAAPAAAAAAPADSATLAPTAEKLPVLAASTSSAAAAADSSDGAVAQPKISHKRFESVIVKSHPLDMDPFGVPPDMDLDWGDFFFNLVSMCIVYVYFSKAAVAGESLVAILLCMGVAAFDVVLLVMRWLWFEQYINYGSIVLHVFQIYRVVVLPVANTWMSWSLLNKMDVTPSYGVIIILGVLLMTFIVLGVQVRFFLHAPLQLASVLFAATSTPDICGMFFESTSSLRCIGMVSALQLTLGLVLPSVMVYFLESRSGRCFMPHMQAKRWLLHP